jgi:hypothetical protein
MNISLRDINAKVCREGIFNPTGMAVYTKLVMLIEVE